MAFAHPRMSLGLRSTPYGSPGTRSPAIRSPIKTVPEEQHHLSLRKVIGTTTATSNAFDALPLTRTVAYTAGATIVVTSFDEGLKQTQKSFRAKPSTAPPPASQASFDSPTPTGRAQAAKDRYPASTRGGSGTPIHVTAAREAIDSPNSRASALKERTKATTCVSLSPDGRLVAAGESGHKPRVLLFSLGRDATSNGPVAALAEHTFGVKCVAFSPDSQYLASLGDINDGFLYIWHVHMRTGAATLHANNRCTSNVRKMAWCGSSLITVGTRHVKIWRLEQDSAATPSKRLTESSFTLASPSKALAGRNCLLGPLLDKVYTSVVAVDDKRAIICSDEGDICLLDDKSSPPLFRKVAHSEFGITTATLQKGGRLFFSGPGGQIAHCQLSVLFTAEPPVSTATSLTPCIQLSNAAVVAMEAFEDQLIVVDSGRSIQILEDSNDAGSSGSLQVARTLHSHDSAVLGLVPLQGADVDSAAFLTCSVNGKVLIWTESGECIRNWHFDIEQDVNYLDGSQNEVRAVAVAHADSLVCSGDRSGVLRVNDLSTGKLQFQAIAHASEVCSITTLQQNDTLQVATSGRDKTIQFFQRSVEQPKQFELVQTIDAHAAAVTVIAFSDDGSRLLSCSTDRTIVVHDALTATLEGRTRTLYSTNRVINLKASPLSMILTGLPTKQMIRVSQADKSVVLHSLDGGTPSTSFKAADEEDSDPVNLNAICHIDAGDGHAFLAGCSSGDKSVRLYDQEGSLVRREYGHTEGLVAIASLKSHGGNVPLVTAATDGTVFLWDVCNFTVPSQDSPSHRSDHESSSQLNGSILSGRPPLRRVISISELSQMQVDEGSDLNSPNSIRTRSRSPKRKPSRSNLRDVPKLDATPPVNYRRRANNASDQGPSSQSRRISRSRPASPDLAPQESLKPLPKSVRRQSSQPALSSSRRKSIAINQTNGPPTDTVLRESTHQLCRALHAYRKKLTVTNDTIPADSLRELEKELTMTIKVLAEKTPAKSEIFMEKVIEKYSEKLVGMLDQRVEEKVKDLVGVLPDQKSQSPSHTESGGHTGAKEGR